jgi:hypothetical protein
MLYPCYPPYCSQGCRPWTTQSWRQVSSVALTATLVPATTPDQQVELVSRWVEQLIRKELGPVLVSLEQERKEREPTQLDIIVSAPVAELISEALSRKAHSML